MQYPLITYYLALITSFAAFTCVHLYANIIRIYMLHKLKSIVSLACWITDDDNDNGMRKLAFILTCIKQLLDEVKHDIMN